MLLPTLTWLLRFLLVSAGIWISAFQVSLFLFAGKLCPELRFFSSLSQTHSRNYFDDGRDFHSLFLLFNFQALNQG